MKPIQVIEVRIWGKQVGAVAPIRSLAAMPFNTPRHGSVVGLIWLRSPCHLKSSAMSSSFPACPMRPFMGCPRCSPMPCRMTLATR